MVGIAGCISVEVEVGVISHVDNCLLICRCCVFYVYGIIIRQLEQNFCRHISGEVFVTIR